MTRISKRYLDEVILDRISEVFWEHISHLSSVKEVKEFFLSVFSETEQIMIPKRLAIAVLLDRGFKFTEIDERIKVSKATITTIQRQMHTGAPGFRNALFDIKHSKQLESQWDSLEEILLHLSIPARYGSTRHRFKMELGKTLRRNALKRSAI